MRYALTFLLLTTYVNTWACTCVEADSTNIQEWLNEADIVVIGEFLEPLTPNEELLDRRRANGRAADVLIQVITILKGNLNSNVIAIYQDNGNCTRYFKLGEKVLIMGNQINSFVSEPVQFVETIEAPPAPPSEVLGDILYWTYDFDDPTSKYWNNILKNYSVFSTSDCSTFNPNSRAAERIVTALNSR